MQAVSNNQIADILHFNDGSDYWRSGLENENTLVIERREPFTDAATKRCSSNLCLAAIIEIIWKCLWRSQTLKKIQMNAFLVTFQGSSSQL